MDPAWSRAAPPTADWCRAHGIPGDYVLFVGALGPRKNLPRLLAAFRAAQVAGLSLVLAGPAGRGAPPDDVPHVVPTGWLEDRELHDLVAGARALALPSLDEGFGLPVLEALAAGRPVLAADVPALREVAGGHAVLADPRDVDALAQGLLNVLAAPDDEAARSARRTWAGRFTWAATADRTVEAYVRAAA
ncbi:glycosyltransferase family 1 protein [Cellulomonas sp. JZ18]|uniref:glycosyltransferase family 4 protein n=1 Tax=Cellulomonas sp. JZ18 TaxID=2654191 RepID=UPI001E637096|nr:glycosyltransferase family 1 protein [Cellulomonas sp. JZ18]